MSRIEKIDKIWNELSPEAKDVLREINDENYLLNSKIDELEPYLESLSLELNQLVDEKIKIIEEKKQLEEKIRHHEAYEEALLDRVTSWTINSNHVENIEKLEKIIKVINREQEKLRNLLRES